MVEFYCHDCQVLFHADPDTLVSCPDCSSTSVSPTMNGHPLLDDDD